MPRVRKKKKKERHLPARLTTELARVDHRLLKLAEACQRDAGRFKKMHRSASTAGEMHERAVADRSQARLEEVVGRIRFGSHGLVDEAGLTGLRSIWAKLGQKKPAAGEKSAESGEGKQAPPQRKPPGAREGDIRKAQPHKYIRRWKGKDGRWRYEYPRDKSSAKRPAKAPKVQPAQRSLEEIKAEGLRIPERCVAEGHKNRRGHFPWYGGKADDPAICSSCMLQMDALDREYKKTKRAQRRAQRAEAGPQRVTLDWGRGELAQAGMLFGGNLRQFHNFPGDVWGRGIHFFLDPKGESLTRTEARSAFQSGKRLFYIRPKTGGAGWVEHSEGGETARKSMAGLFLRAGDGALALADLGDSSMRRFVLVRKEDLHDTSGTGEVVEGIEFSDGRVALRWRTKTSSTVIYDSVADMLEVHGHEGRTTIRYLDEGEVSKATAVLGHWRQKPAGGRVWIQAHIRQGGRKTTASKKAARRREKWDWLEVEGQRFSHEDIMRLWAARDSVKEYDSEWTLPLEPFMEALPKSVQRKVQAVAVKDTANSFYDFEGRRHITFANRRGFLYGLMIAMKGVVSAAPVQPGVFVGVPAYAAPPGTPETTLHHIRQRSGIHLRGTPMAVDDPRIGEHVYHMTTNLPAVVDSGVLLARGAGGLGGDKQDQIVSTTISKRVAMQLAKDTRWVAQLAQRYIPAWPAYADGRNNSARGEIAAHMVRELMQVAKKEGWELEDISPDPKSLAGASFKDIINRYFTRREMDTKDTPDQHQLNPLFFSSEAELLRMDPDNVGVLKIPKGNLRTGAMLTDFDLGRNIGLREVRIYGDLPIEGAATYGPEEFGEYIPPKAITEPATLRGETFTDAEMRQLYNAWQEAGQGEYVEVDKLLQAVWPTFREKINRIIDLEEDGYEEREVDRHGGWGPKTALFWRMPQKIRATLEDYNIFKSVKVKGYYRTVGGKNVWVRAHRRKVRYTGTIQPSLFPRLVSGRTAEIWQAILKEGALPDEPATHTLYPDSVFVCWVESFIEGKVKGVRDYDLKQDYFGPNITAAKDDVREGLLSSHEVWLAFREAIAAGVIQVAPEPERVGAAYSRRQYIIPSKRQARKWVRSWLKRATTVWGKTELRPEPGGTPVGTPQPSSFQATDGGTGDHFAQPVGVGALARMFHLDEDIDRATVVLDSYLGAAYPDENLDPDEVADRLTTRAWGRTPFHLGVVKHAWTDYTEKARGKVKRELVSELAYRTGVPFYRTNDIIKQWAQTASDEDYRSLHLQQMAAEELGVEVSESHQGRFEEIEQQRLQAAKRYQGILAESREQGGKPVLSWAGDTDYVALVEAKAWGWAGDEIRDFLDRRYLEHGMQGSLRPMCSDEEAKKVIRASYALTQEALAEAGLKADDEVVLYRGTKWKRWDTEGYDPGDEVEVAGSPLSSWSLSYATAGDFAGTSEAEKEGIILAVKVPVSAILSTCRTGFGCLNEGEIILSGGVEDCTATIVHIQSVIRAIENGELSVGQLKNLYSDHGIEAAFTALVDMAEAGHGYEEEEAIERLIHLAEDGDEPAMQVVLEFAEVGNVPAIRFLLEYPDEGIASTMLKWVAEGNQEVGAQAWHLAMDGSSDEGWVPIFEEMVYQGNEDGIEALSEMAYQDDTNPVFFEALGRLVVQSDKALEELHSHAETHGSELAAKELKRLAEAGNADAKKSLDEIVGNLRALAEAGNVSAQVMLDDWGIAE